MNSKDKKLYSKIVELLKTNGMYYDVEVFSGVITITVENGDWKHDHIFLRNIMKSHGYIFIGRHITDEENGDDSFSATYLYMEEV
jgi:hypothetical protein